jgi:hypothetical protein
MNLKQNSAIAAPVLIRTGGIVPKSGIWRVRCSRDGCHAVEKLNLHQGAPAPPCIRCLNPARLTFLYVPAPAVDEARTGTIVGPHHFSTRLVSARFGEITLTWRRGATEPATALLPAPPTESVHSARGWATPPTNGVAVSWSVDSPPGGVAFVSTRPKEIPGAAPEPSLFQKIMGKPTEKKAP